MKQAWFEVRRRDLDVSVVGIFVEDQVAKELDGDKYATFLAEKLVGAEVRFLTIGDHLTYEHVTFASAARSVELMTLNLWVGLEPNPDDRLKLSVSEEDLLAYNGLPRGASDVTVVVTDIPTQRRYEIKRGDCGLKCFCAAVLVGEIGG